jgi:hypothetical protein
MVIIVREIDQLGKRHKAEHNMARALPTFYTST